MLHESALLEQIASGDMPLPGLTDDSPGAAVNILERSKLALLPAEKPFSFLSIGEMKKRHKPAEWIIDGFVQKDATVLFIGESTAGKSFLGIDMACCIATGTGWKGRDVVAGPVFYIAGEGHGGFVKRVRAWEIRHGQSIADAPLLFSEMPAALMEEASADAVIKAVEAMIKLYGNPAMIIVDTLHRNFGGGDENSAADFGKFMANIDRMRSRLKASVLVVHHSGHGDKSRGRGSSSIKASMDHEYILTKEADGRRLLTCSKMKDGKEPEPVYFTLRTVELDLLDAKGRQEESAVLDVSDDQAPCPARKESTSKPLDFVRQAIAVTGSNQQEVVRNQFYALYGKSPGANQKAFVRGWKMYMAEFEKIDVEESVESLLKNRP